MGRYIQRSIVVDAWQISRDWNTYGEVPGWVADEMEKKRIIIEFRKNEDGSMHFLGAKVRTPTGRSSAKAGDYIVKEPDGGLYVRKKCVFERFYVDKASTMPKEYAAGMEGVW